MDRLDKMVYDYIGDEKTVDHATKCFDWCRVWTMII
jgi:hypothetical protein